MKQLFKELFFLILIIPVSLVVVFFVMQKAEESRQIEKLTGVIEKKEITLASPVFGSIEKFYVEEGDIVEKGQILADITIIDNKESISLSSDIYTHKNASTSVSLKSPAEAIVITKSFDEKSTIKPQETLVTLSPIEKTVVKIAVNKETDITEYEVLTLTDTKQSYHYPLTMTKRLPVADKEGNVFYFATLVDTEKAKYFYNNQQVIVEARKPKKALTGKVEAAMSLLSDKFMTYVQRYL